MNLSRGEVVGQSEEREEWRREGEGGTGGRGREKGGQLRQAERMQPLLSPGAYDIEQQRQSIRSNIQQAPAQWIVARGRRGGGRATWTRERGRGEGEPAIKSRACRDPPWITALIESLSDVPWSRVILLPKQLLSSMVYSHLFHPAAPADPPRPPSALHVPPSLYSLPPLSLSPGFRHLRSRTILCSLSPL